MRDGLDGSIEGKFRHRASTTKAAGAALAPSQVKGLPIELYAILLSMTAMGTNNPWPPIQTPPNCRATLINVIGIASAESRKIDISGQPMSKPPLQGEATGETLGQQTLVSVIIPAYNAARTIKRTLKSALDQTYTNLEIIVVDDGSTDETSLLIQRMADLDHRIKLLRKANGGVSSARNYGIQSARGEFIAPLDADDLWHPEKIAKQLTAMRDYIGVIYCWSRVIDDQDRVLYDLAPCTLRGDVYAALITTNFLHSSTLLIRRSCIEEVGGYDQVMSYCEDLKFNLELAERYDFDVIPEFLSAYRLHEGSLHRNLDALLNAHKVVVKWARARHPELPGTLFRWANAHRDVDFGLTYLGDKRLLLGTWLILKCLTEDPSTALRGGAPRIFSRLSRSRIGANLLPLLGSTGSRPTHRKFLDVDRTAAFGAIQSPWSDKRLAYLNALVVTRVSNTASRECAIP